MRVIPLTRGALAIVDDADYESVSQFRWQVVDCDGHLYARRTRQYAERTEGISTSEYMHRFLTGWPLVDHVNGIGLDNRRANLRPASPSENCANRAKTLRGSSSPFKGVTRYRRTGRWRAYVTEGGRQFHIGYFDTAEEAARAYDAEASARFGEFALLNFQDQSRSSA